MTFYQSRLHLAGRRALFRSYVGPDRQTTPRYHTLLLGVIVLVVFFTSLCLAARYPTKSVRIVFVSISGLLFTALSVSVGTDLATKGKLKRWKPCFHDEAHSSARGSQIHQEPWQHYTARPPHDTLNDDVVCLHLVSRTKQEAGRSEPGHLGW